MLRDNYQELAEGKDLRRNLADLRKELSDEYSRKNFDRMIGGDYHVILALLADSDPKVRKNACSVVGMCRPKNGLGQLMAAYRREKTLYVRPYFLKAMALYDCSSLLAELKEQELRLMLEDIPEEDLKHRTLELAQLRSIIASYETQKKHTFIMPSVSPDVILITNRNQREATLSQIRLGSVKKLGAGLRVNDGDLLELLSIRTVEEYLFPVPGLAGVSGDPEQVGEQLAASSLISFLKQMHLEDAPFFFRIELRSDLSPDKKGAFIRKISNALERRSGGALRGNASDYEFELRLIQRKDKSFIALVKLFTLPDNRFSYRTGQTSESVSPVNAALAITLAKPYLKEGAQVLDPFCGVGTMLVERAKAGPVGMMFATDIYGEAIHIGRENAELADVPIHFIHRDFFTFTHEYPFDEVISDLPRQDKDTDTGEYHSPEALYSRFFERIPTLLKAEAVLVLYTPQKEELLNAIKGKEAFHMEQKFLLNERAGTTVFIIRYSKKS